MHWSIFAVKENREIIYLNIEYICIVLYSVNTETTGVLNTVVVVERYRLKSAFLNHQIRIGMVKYSQGFIFIYVIGFPCDCCI